jgi:hypothetical protein
VTSPAWGLRTVLNRDPPLAVSRNLRRRGAGGVRMGNEEPTENVIRRIGRAWLARKGLAPADPKEPIGIVLSNARSVALAEQVFDLLDQDLPDREIVRKLTASAGGRRRDLKVAAQLVNIENYAHELSHYNHAWRLLNAAAAGTDPDAGGPSAADVARFDVLDALSDEPEELAFPKLVDREPRLGELAERLAGDPRPTLTSFAQLDALLEPLVGPYAESADPVLRSHVALRLCHVHLARTSGLVET